MVIKNCKLWISVDWSTDAQNLVEQGKKFYEAERFNDAIASIGRKPAIPMFAIPPVVVFLIR